MSDVPEFFVGNAKYHKYPVEDLASFAFEAPQSFTAAKSSAGNAGRAEKAIRTEKGKKISVRKRSKLSLKKYKLKTVAFPAADIV